MNQSRRGVTRKYGEISHRMDIAKGIYEDIKAEMTGFISLQIACDRHEATRLLEYYVCVRCRGSRATKRLFPMWRDWMVCRHV